MRNELNDRNVGGDLYKAGCVLDEIKAANEYFLSKPQNLSGASNSNNVDEVVIANDYFVLNGSIRLPLLSPQERIQLCINPHQHSCHSIHFSYPEGCFLSTVQK